MTRSGIRFAWRRRAIIATVACSVLLLSASSAGAEFGLEPGSFISDTFDPDVGTTFSQAGGHPVEATTAFSFNKATDLDVDGAVRDIDVDLPQGFYGNPQAVPMCPRASFDGLLNIVTVSCPPASQVGHAEVILYGGAPQYVPVYNLEPMPGEVAEFGMPVLTVPVRLVAEVDSSGMYRLRVKVVRVPQALPILSTRLTLWGVPASRRHDGQRACDGKAIIWLGSFCSVGAPERPFLTNPSDCAAGPLTTNIAVDSWQNPGDWKRYSYTTDIGVTGCELLRFEPRISVRSDSSRAGTPAGLTVDIDIPQNDDPYGIATPPLRDARVTLPPGMVISPPSADGLQGCTDAQFGYRSDAEVACPNPSQIATVELRTPLLAEPMRGEVFLGQPQPGNLFRLFMTLRGPGLSFKLPGVARPDPATGQITATFLENPPLPFSNLHLEFKGGPRAPLVNPSTCGAATTTASLTAWGVDMPATPSSTFQITHAPDGRPCRTQGFSPTLQAGLMNPVAGASSAFTLTFARGDEDHMFRDITADMPEGLTGVIASAQLCSDREANAGTCGPRSQIGSTMTGAGQGSNPFFLPGRVYVTESYKGAPFGMSIVVPAIAGPFDLGTVVVRAAIFVDPTDASLRVVSDPLPTILEGVPLQIRKVNVKIDKPGFMLAPTNCTAKVIAARISSVFGASASASSRFQVGDCAALPFKPRMSLSVGKRGRTHRDTTTPFSATLRMTPGQANNRSVRVTLPKAINGRLRIINQACTLAEYHADRCGAGARAGQAVAVTPLLRDPLRGSAYFVRNPARRIPDLMVALKGQVDFDLTGQISIPRDLSLSTNFDLVPDVPITSFRLDLVAGRNGAIGTTANLCSARTRRGLFARLAIRAHSGRLVESRQRMQVAGCGRASARGRRAGPARRARRGGRQGRRGRSRN